MGEEGCCPTMDLLRSEPMHLAQLIVPIESSYRAISYLGDLGKFQFKDVSDNYAGSFLYPILSLFLDLFGSYFELHQTGIMFQL